MLKKGDMVEFKEWMRMQRHPIVLFVDFEALIITFLESKGTQAFQRYDPMSYTLYIKISDDVPVEFLEQYEIPQSLIIFRSCEIRQEVAKYFVRMMADIVQIVKNLLKPNMLIIITNEERRRHVTNTNCNLCKSVYTTDHNHSFELYCQTLCHKYNLKLKTLHFIP